MECFRAWYEPSSSSRCSGSRCQIMTSCHPIYEVSMELSLLSLNHDYWSSTATCLYYQLATSSDPRPEYCIVWLPAGPGAPIPAPKEPGTRVAVPVYSQVPFTVLYMTYLQTATASGMCKSLLKRISPLSQHIP